MKFSTSFAQVGVLVACLAAFVTMAVKGDSTAELVSLMSPVLSAVFVMGRVDQRSDAQDQALTQITAQTNGVLTGRIKNAVSAALAERDANATPNVPTGPEPNQP